MSNFLGTDMPSFTLLGPPLIILTESCHSHSPQVKLELAYGRVVVGRWSLLGVAWAFGLLRETAETQARLKQVKRP